MEHKKTNDPEYPHSLTFTVWEVETVKAAYTESNVIAEQLGNSGRADDRENSVILTPEEEILVLNLPGLEDILSKLVDFAERTDELAGEAARLPFPAHANKYPAERRRLGQQADYLVTEIRRIQTQEEPPLTEEQMVEQLNQELQDGPPEL
jgi:hypothetical protein